MPNPPKPPLESRRYDLQKERLAIIADRIAELAGYKDEQYLSSWRKRGGVGAYMTFVRKWDRIEASVEDERQGTKYDVFERFANDVRKESIAHDCVDLVGYLLVLLEHMVETENISMEDLHRITCTAASKSSEMEHPFGYDEEEE